MTAADDRTMERVRALLAQAEHPNTSEAEAEAFTGRAMALMAKYGIDQAMLAATGHRADEQTSIRIAFDQPYTHAKLLLLAAVAAPLNGYIVSTSHGRIATCAHVYGARSDLERIELLYTSLLIQATRDVLRQPTPPTEGTAAYRRSWLNGFRLAVYQRLDEQRRRAAAEAERTAGGPAGGPSVELVLADRKALAQRTAEHDNPNLRKYRPSNVTGSGTRAGYQAGQRADLGGTKLTADSRRRIGGAR